MGEELVIENRRKNPRRGRISFCMLVLLALLIALLLLFIILAFATKGFGLWTDKSCHSKECIDASARVMQYMDPSADPCTDFYQYACGNFGDHHVIHPGNTGIGTFHILSKKQTRNVKNLLEKENPNDPEYVKEAKVYYESCMNETVIDDLGIKPLKERIAALGGWAVVDKNFDLSKFEFDDYWVKFGSDSSYPGYYNTIFGVSAEPDPDSHSKYIVQLRQTGLGMGGGTRDHYLKGRDDKLVKAYEKLINDIAQLLGGDATYAQTEIAKIVSFEIELAKINMKPEDMRESQNNSRVVTVNELGSLYKGVDWKRIIGKTFQGVGISVNDSNRVRVRPVPFFQSVGALIERTHSKTLAGYMMWRNIQRNLGYLDKKTRDIRREFYIVKTGVNTPPPRYEYCVGKTKYGYPLVVGRMFADEYFNASLDGMRDLIDRVKTVFEQRLDAADWLDKESRDLAKEKVKAMKTKLGYPDLMMNDVLLKAHVDKNAYKKMELDQFFTNAVNVRQSRGEFRLKHLSEPVDPNEWWGSPVTVNAYYSHSTNYMTYPLGILYPPFYDVNGLNALNFGGIGEVIGHEITHGFDDSGRLYDKEGNKKQWMTPGSIDGFNVKAQCVVAAYSNITVEQIGEKVNGKLTVGENIADLGGVAMAFQAYQTWLRENGDEKLPGLDLNPMQLFFVNYAQLSCQLSKDKALKLQIRSDSHTPSRERVLGALYNTKEFGDVFNCPVGSRMNPKDKCHVW